MTAHTWASQTQNSGQNASHTLFFKGKTIYSYGEHFPIASYSKPNLILVTTDSYSVTTSHHVSLVRNAIDYSNQIFYVPIVQATSMKEHSTNLEYLKTQAEQCIFKSNRARLNKDSLLLQAKKYQDSYNGYCEAFKIKRKTYVLPDFDVIKSKLANASKNETKRARAKLARLKKQNAEKIEKWINGERVSLPYGIDTMLRISPNNPGIVETSQNASFPLSHAIKAYKVIRRLKGKAWMSNGHSIKLGNFHIDAIDKTGNIKAGCHLMRAHIVSEFGEKILKLEGEKS